jgi:adenine deaminase
MGSRVEVLKERIRAARGEILPDLVLKAGKILDVLCGEVREEDLAVHLGQIVGIGSGYKGKTEVDCRGKWVAPGLLDGHFHIESSMLLPSALTSALVPCGTTAMVADPHEIANVLGLEGIRFLLKESEFLPMDFFFMAPSCVPATPLETSGSTLAVSELKELRKEPRVLGLAEMMNYPGVLACDREVLEKIALFHDRLIDGHAPSLSGRDLQAYMTAGIRSDHETTDRESGSEKVGLGMMLMIREGTSARNLEELLPLVSPQNASRFCFVSDDLHPGDILGRGHLDHMVRKSIRLGLDPITAVRLASISPASHFGLRDRGALAPGYRADLVVLGDLEEFLVERVYKDGRLVAEEGKLTVPIATPRQSLQARPLNVAGLTPERFRVSGRKGGRVRVIELVSGQILTRSLTKSGVWSNGALQSDTQADILRLAVLERHHGSGRVGLGLVKGFGLKNGALASSVAHDSHNLIVVGVTEDDLYEAARVVVEMGGGMAAVRGGEVLCRMGLSFGGLISDRPLADVVQGVRDLGRAAQLLGCTLPDPFMVLSFLALPVIPDLRLTDRGLVDVNQFEFVPLFAEE